MIGECQGDCDNDGHCAGNLKCAHDKYNDPIPGCHGSTKSNWDYCYDPTKLAGICPEDGAESCASCNTGYQLVSSGVSGVKKCMPMPHFSLKAGSKGVEINEHGCITDGPGAYTANERAEITVNYAGMLDVIHFKTHDEYRDWNNGWKKISYAQLYGGGQAKWTRRDTNHFSAYYTGSRLAVSRAYERYSSGDSGAISHQYGRYSKNGWYNDNWYFTDYLEINNRRYHGPDSPDGVRVKAGTKIQWQTDGSHQEAGFIVCLDPNPPPVPAPVFEVKNFNGQEGVKLTAQGCFTDGYGFYRSNERSEITVLKSGVLFARHFSTEKRYDTLTINGVQYSGDDQVDGNSPDGVAVTAGDLIEWKSDHQMIRSGFIICLGSQKEHDCQPKNCQEWTCTEWCNCHEKKSEDNGEYAHFGCVDDGDESCKCE